MKWNVSAWLASLREIKLPSIAKGSIVKLEYSDQMQPGNLAPVPPPGAPPQTPDRRRGRINPGDEGPPPWLRLELLRPVTDGRALRPLRRPTPEDWDAWAIHTALSGVFGNGWIRSGAPG